MQAKIYLPFASSQTLWRRRVGRRFVGELYIVVKPPSSHVLIVKWNHRVEDKLLYRGVRLFAYRASSLSRAAVRMADIYLTEALGVQFYCLSLLAATVRFW